MMKTVSLLNEYITAELDSGLDPSRVVLGGFSQGAAMSLLTGLSSKHKLGGVVVLSGWLPLRNRFASVSVIPIHLVFADTPRSVSSWPRRMQTLSRFSGDTALLTPLCYIDSGKLP